MNDVVKISNQDSSLENDTKFLVEERVKKIFKKLNHCVESNGLIDVTRLVNSFNFEIVENIGLPKLLNGIVTCDMNGNQMCINNNLSKESKRYSIAYLLSTYLLYYSKQEFFSFNHLESCEDYNAAFMARLLLIPESILRTAYSNSNGDIQYLSELFEVPSNVMEQRLKEINKFKKFALKKYLI